jgi:hypothetical protein
MEPALIGTKDLGSILASGEQFGRVLFSKPQLERNMTRVKPFRYSYYAKFYSIPSEELVLSWLKKQYTTVLTFPPRTGYVLFYNAYRIQPVYRIRSV